jgi:hypothetical protein
MRTHSCPYCGGDPTERDHRWRCDGRQGALEFDAAAARAPAEDDDDDPPPDLRGMTHHDDPYTSLDAAATIARHRTELHARVLQAFLEHGPMTDAELEQLPEFHGYGPSTLRKRRSELYHAHDLAAIGERRNARNCKMLVWSVRPKTEAD